MLPNQARPAPGTVTTPPAHREFSGAAPSEPWHARAACHGVDPRTFDPFTAGERLPVFRDRVAEARRVCAACPVAAACLRSALAHRDVGIRAGFLFSGHSPRSSVSTGRASETPHPETTGRSVTPVLVVDQAAATVPALPARREDVPRPARYGWACRGVVMEPAASGELVVRVPSQAYAAIAGWRSRHTWLRAFGAHPRLSEAARRYETCPARIAQVMALLAGCADLVTGRNIAVAHATIARQLQVTPKTVQRCCWAAEDLGLLVRVLDGSDMTLVMRMQIRDHYPRGDKRGTRSKLPNVYAATLPRWLATNLPGPRPKPARGALAATTAARIAAGSVDNVAGRTGLGTAYVHPPVGGTPPPSLNVLPYLRTRPFSAVCGHTAGLQQQPDKTDAARPTKTHQQTRWRPRAPRLEPAVEQFAQDLRRLLVGFSGVSLARIGPALRLYVSAGLSPTDLQRGLDHYLSDTGQTWRTYWQPGQDADQAKYLVSTLGRARRAGYIKPPTEPGEPSQPNDTDGPDTEPCPHGVLGGARILAGHGVLRCPLCRSGHLC